MTTSVNTNIGALTALASLRSTNKEIDIVSKRIQTGYKVADAFDDASTFSVAQGIRASIKQYAAVQQSLSNGEGIGSVASSALKGISDLIGDIKSKVTQLSDGSLSSSQVTTYSTDLLKQLTQVSNYITQANYNGRNLFTNSNSVSFLADLTGTTLSLSSQSTNTSGAFNTFSAAAITFTAGVFSNPGSASFITSVNTAMGTFENAINAAMGTVAAETRSLSLQKSFINDLVDATKKGLGAMVDADVAAESAAYQSLQVKQQLGYQALSIANQAPNAILALFR